MLPRGGRLRCMEERLLNGNAFIHIWQVTVFSVDALRQHAEYIDSENEANRNR